MCTLLTDLKLRLSATAGKSPVHLILVSTPCDSQLVVFPSGVSHPSSSHITACEAGFCQLAGVPQPLCNAGYANSTCLQKLKYTDCCYLSMLTLLCMELNVSLTMFPYVYVSGLSLSVSLFCLSMFFRWHPDLDGGVGACELVSVRPNAAACAAYGGVWRGGHRWEAGKWDTAEKCLAAASVRQRPGEHASPL